MPCTVNEKKTEVSYINLTKQISEEGRLYIYTHTCKYMYLITNLK
jgi:hypothetical protein